jgi:glycosyltransferase involved in cell wall biosynthesis
VIVDLVSYFFRPVENVASQRWSRFADVLRKTGREVRVTTGPWQDGSPTLDLTCLPDDFSEDSRIERTRLAGRAQPDRQTEPLAWAALKKLFPTYLLMDGKWRWSWRVFLHLLRSPAQPDGERVVVATGAPWSVFPAVALACKLRGLPYVLDLRDHWAAYQFSRFNGFLPRSYFAQWERFCIRGARRVITVSEPIREHLARWIPAERVLVVPNGYEGDLEWTETTFNGVAGMDRSILYAGTLAAYHGIERFFDAIGVLEKTVAIPPLAFLCRDTYGGLKGRTGLQVMPSVPAAEADRKMAKAGVLLLTLDRKSTEFISGKLMSYLKAGRPILYFGPVDTPAARLIRDAGLGWVVDCQRPNDGLADAVRQIDAVFRSGTKFSFQPQKEALRGYSVSRLALKVGDWIDQAALPRHD